MMDVLIVSLGIIFIPALAILCITAMMSIAVVVIDRARNHAYAKGIKRSKDLVKMVRGWDR